MLRDVIFHINIMSYNLSILLPVMLYLYVCDTRTTQPVQCSSVIHVHINQVSYILLVGFEAERSCITQICFIVTKLLQIRNYKLAALKDLPIFSNSEIVPTSRYIKKSTMKTRLYHWADMATLRFLLTDTNGKPLMALAQYHTNMWIL